MDNTKFWNKAARKYAAAPIKNLAGYVETRDKIRALLQPSDRVLELGCGTGSSALELADGVADYLGTDLSSEMIAIAQSKQTDTTPAHLRFEVLDVAMPPAGSHNVVIALNLFHLVPELETVLGQIFDQLPAGGRLIAKTSLLGDGAWYIRGLIPVMRLLRIAPYVRIVGVEEMRRLFENSGFVMDDDLVQTGAVPRLFSVARKP